MKQTLYFIYINPHQRYVDVSPSSRSRRKRSLIIQGVKLNIECEGLNIKTFKNRVQRHGWAVEVLPGAGNISMSEIQGRLCNSTRECGSSMSRFETLMLAYWDAKSFQNHFKTYKSKYSANKSLNLFSVLKLK